MQTGENTQKTGRRWFAWQLPRRIRRDESGSTAVEFGIVALPFFALVLAIMETALVFFAGQMLETAVIDAGRLIRTGQAHQQGFSQTKFRDQICDRLVAMFGNCKSNLVIKVKVLTTFSSASGTKPIKPDGTLDTNSEYNQGKAGEIIQVSAFYEWPLFVNKFGLNLADLGNGNRLLSGVTAFRNEPFPW